MLKVIQNRVSIRDDYKGRPIGFLKIDETIYPVKILNNWVMFIENDKYVWSKMYDDKNIYIMDIDNYTIETVNHVNIDKKYIISYINSIS